MTIPVVTIDGPGGSGKGSICQLLAKEMGWHLLDSGALYRIVGLAAQRQGVSFDDEAALAELARSLNVEFLLCNSGNSRLNLGLAFTVEEYVLD